MASTFHPANDNWSTVDVADIDSASQVSPDGGSSGASSTTISSKRRAHLIQLKIKELQKEADLEIKKIEIEKQRIQELSNQERKIVDINIRMSRTRSSVIDDDLDTLDSIAGRSQKSTFSVISSSLHSISPDIGSSVFKDANQQSIAPAALPVAYSYLQQARPTNHNPDLQTINQSLNQRSTNHNPDLPTFKQSLNQRLTNHSPDLPTFNQSLNQRSADHSPDLPTVNQSLNQRSTNHSPDLPTFKQSLNQRSTNHNPDLPTFNQSLNQRSTNHNPDLQTFKQSLNQRSTNHNPDLPTINRPLKPRQSISDIQYNSQSPPERPQSYSALHQGSSNINILTDAHLDLLKNGPEIEPNDADALYNLATTDVVVGKSKSEEFIRTIQMRLYTLSKRQFVLVFVAFFTCFLLTVFAGLAGPHIINTTSVNNTSPQKETPTGPYTFMSPVMSTFNQQMWLLAKVKVKNPSGATISQDFTLSVRIFTIGPDASGNEGTHTHNRTRTLRCTGSMCDPIVVLHLGYLEYTRIRVEVNFYKMEDLSYSVNDVSFEFKSYNPTFTQIEIWFRFVFLVISFLVTCMFAHTLRRFHMRDWTIEQKWTSVLLPLLLLYNDPIFPLSFLINSWIPGFIDTVFQATFLCTLLLFWLCVYHGMRAATERRRFLTFYFPKILICFLLWLAAVTLGSWQQYNELTDPTYQYKLDITNFTGMKILFFIVGGTYVLYLLFLLVRACSELRLKPYFNLRLRFLTLLTAFVLIISIIIMVLRFGTNALQDNFVADISTQYDNSAEFVCFYALLNFYMFTMAFVYSPSKTAQEESDFDHHPGFSRLNDSDEDVLYGSDSEDVPLSNGKLRKPQYYDDSD